MDTVAEAGPIIFHPADNSKGAKVYVEPVAISEQAAEPVFLTQYPASFCRAMEYAAVTVLYVPAPAFQV